VKLAEGVDFIETEEDAKAVEAATLKIQSTFRGKKIRSKFGGGGQTGAQTGGQTAGQTDGQKAEKTGDIPEDREPPATKEPPSDKLQQERAARELSKKVAEMQVHDKETSPGEKQQQQVGDSSVSLANFFSFSSLEKMKTFLQLFQLF